MSPPVYTFGGDSTFRFFRIHRRDGTPANYLVLLKPGPSSQQEEKVYLYEVFLKVVPYMMPTLLVQDLLFSS